MQYFWEFMFYRMISFLAFHFSDDDNEKISTVQAKQHKYHNN